MGDSSCMNCKKWEETIYWSHFQTVQFFQILSGCYDHQLAIPQKFADNLREKLTGSVSLKGPSGVVWNVGLEADGDNLYLKRGWNKFVKEHSLQENDVLVFKHNGNLQFDVLMFDQLSLCEKESSYFIKQCGHKELGNEDKIVKTPTSNIYFETTSSESSHEDFERSRKTPRKGVVSKQLTQANQKSRKGSRGRSGPLSTVHRLQVESNRRPVTEEEKGKAIEAASAAASGDSITVVMKECHVYKGFYLTIPAEWSRTHFPRKNIDVCLRVNEKTWISKCYQRTSGHGLSGGGWKNFALENSLEKDDVCVFNMVSVSSTLCIFDVHIFRVVEEIAPKKSITTGSSSKKGGRTRKHPKPAADQNSM